MKKSVRVLNFLLATAPVALVAAPFSADAAEPELQFYPSEKWSVSATDSLCTVKATFNNGFTVRLLGNEKWVRALDIDFKQNIFQRGDTHTSTLSVPGVATKTIDGQAQSSSLLAFGMNGNKEFYKALKQSAVLDTEIQGNEFRFIMTGFGNKAREFENCMADVATYKTASNEAPNANESFMVNEAVSMEENMLQEQASPEPIAIAETAAEEPQAVIQEIPYTETQKVGEYTVSETVPEAQRPTEPGKRLSDQLAAQIANDPSLIDVDDSRAPERKELEVPAEIAAMPVIPEAPTPIVEPESEPEIATPPPQDTLSAPEPIEAAEAEIAEEVAVEVEEEEAVIVETAEVVEPLDDEMAPVTEEQPEPVKETVTFKTPEPKINREKITHDADFRRDTSGATAMSAELRQDVIRLESTIEQLKAENKALNDELKTTVRASEEERLTIASENWNLERATMQYNEAERQLKRLGNQLQKERAQCAMEKRELEAMLFDPQVTEQAQLASLAALEDELIKAKRELETQRIRYEERIRLLESTQ